MAHIKAQEPGTLDLLRQQHGNEAARNTFYDLCTQDRDRAAQLLNMDNVKFSTLFTMRPEIEKFELWEKLSPRNREALALCGCLANPDSAMGREYGPDDTPLLRWMLLSGYDEDDLGENYDEIMDTVSILLARENHDTETLPHLCEMMFRKNRRGLYTYDNVWALFESQEPAVLQMVADRLLSRDRHDVELARKLLGFLPGFDEGLTSPAAQHRHALCWIKTNRKWLRYTGISNQQGSNPFRFEVSLEAKYLQNAEVTRSGPETLGVEEYERGNRFWMLDPDTKALLAERSAQLHDTAPKRWRQWMRADLSAQIAEARRHAGLEVRS